MGPQTAFVWSKCCFDCKENTKGFSYVCLYLLVNILDEVDEAAMRECFPRQKDTGLNPGFFFLTGGETHGKHPSPLEPQFLCIFRGWYSSCKDVQFPMGLLIYMKYWAHYLVKVMIPVQGKHYHYWDHYFDHNLGNTMKLIAFVITYLVLPLWGLWVL